MNGLPSLLSVNKFQCFSPEKGNPCRRMQVNEEFADCPLKRGNLVFFQGKSENSAKCHLKDVVQWGGGWRNQIRMSSLLKHKWVSETEMSFRERSSGSASSGWSSGGSFRERRSPSRTPRITPSNSSASSSSRQRISSGWSSGGSFRERSSPTRPRVAARVTKSQSERISPKEKATKVGSVFGRIRRSFRRKKESYCISCGAVTKSCQHSGSQFERGRGGEVAGEKNNYENLEFVNNKEDLLKWLDLDLSHGINNNSAAALRLRYKVHNMIGKDRLEKWERKLWRGGVGGVWGAQGDQIAKMIGRPGRKKWRGGADKAEMQTFLRFLKFLLSLPFHDTKSSFLCHNFFGKWENFSHWRYR